MEEITDPDYVHVKRVCKNFQIQNFCEYHHLHVKSDILLIADIFENFQNICLIIYELDLAHFLSASRLAWEEA